MDWLLQLMASESAARTVLVLSLVVASGIALGHVRVFGISLGIAGVLFTGLFVGHFRLSIHPDVLGFVREFGLVLFVFTIGMQVGPSFFASFRKQGLRLNLMAASIVLLGVAVAVALFYALHLPVPVLVGILSGAVTNTPGLGAAQEALKDAAASWPEAAQVSGMAYAVAYPFGVIGIILSMIAVRRLFRVNAQKEAEDYDKVVLRAVERPVNYNIEVKNPRLAGQPLPVVSSIVQADFVISRVLRKDAVIVPTGETLLQLGDILHAVCTKQNADKLAILVGDVSEVDVRKVPSQLTARNILITRNEAVGRSIADLELMSRCGVAITRVHRAGNELVAKAHMELHFGDRVTVVGEDSALRKVAAELGDSLKTLNYPNILPVFLGVILGVLLGSVPFNVPGAPAPVKLGLAGGPLLVALLLSRYGRVGPVVWYLPSSANLALREVGITLFLACVGLKSGEGFVETLRSGDGLLWMGAGAAITLIPLLVVSAIARLAYRMNYLSLCGLLAGSMTDPPALSFANQVAASDAPAITYSSVYALVMFLRILSAQALVPLLR
jgi:putative transport protein